MKQWSGETYPLHSSDMSKDTSSMIITTRHWTAMAPTGWVLLHVWGIAPGKWNEVDSFFFGQPNLQIQYCLCELIQKKCACDRQSPRITVIHD